MGHVTQATECLCKGAYTVIQIAGEYSPTDMLVTFFVVVNNIYNVPEISMMGLSPL